MLKPVLARVTPSVQPTYRTALEQQFLSWSSHIWDHPAQGVSQGDSYAVPPLGVARRPEPPVNYSSQILSGRRTPSGSLSSVFSVSANRKVRKEKDEDEPYSRLCRGSLGRP